MSGLVAFARNCSSPKRAAYALLLFPSHSSRFNTNFIFGSIGIATRFAHSSPSLFRMFSTYLFWVMVIHLSPCVISIPTIFASLPRSVTSHSECRSFFILLFNPGEEANNNKSSTHTVMISNSPHCSRTYAHESEHKHLNLCLWSITSNSLFHSRPDCFKP